MTQPVDPSNDDVTAPAPARAARLLTAVRLVATAPDAATVHAVAASAARAVTGADGATLVLRDGGHCRYVDEDAISPLWKGRRFAASDCVSGWVMARHRPARIPDVLADDRVPRDAYRPTFVRSMLMVPMGWPECRGAIGAYWATLDGPTGADLRLVSAIADVAGLALDVIEARGSGGGDPWPGARHGQR
ncbi:MAG TPA: GAF domain-containing protein [Baekduia sp.]|nr:GAF domain-containing protein [Baekduia sp.]